MGESLVTIILISLGILFIPFLSRLIKVPVAVGEILYGIAVGNAGLNLIHGGQWLEFLSSFGFLLLMFIAGLEVKVKELYKLPLKKKLIYTAIPLLIFLLSTILGGKLKLPTIVSLSLGVISVGIIVSFLKEKKLLQSEFGKTVFTVGLIGEVFSISILTFYSLYSKFQLSISFWLGLVELLFYLIIARVILVFLKSFVWWYPNRFKFFFEKNPSEIGVRISLAIMFALSIAASFIHLEPIIGAFIAGTIFSTVFEETENIEEKLSGISFGFLIPIFFISVGANFKLPEISYENLKLLTLLVVLSIGIKVLVSQTLLLFKFNLKETTAAGLLFSAPLTLVVVTAEIGKELGLINETLEGIMILLAIITGIVAPFVSNLLLGEERVESSNS